ncbi:MAG: glycosyltransferase [Vicinamibacterales bacterium]
MRILQVGTIDSGGGAAAVGFGLSHGYRARGHRTWFVVGRRQSDDPAVLVIRENRRPFYRLIGYSAVQVRLRRLAGRFPNRGFGLVGRALRYATHPHVVLNQLRGVEDFEFPGSYELLDMLDRRPDIVQCHNLHGGYFDLRALEWLSAQVPTVLTLHDMWTLTGHCAYSIQCDRWKAGCGRCPDLHLDPAIRRDNTAENWTRKRDIYAGSRLYVATPSQWLLDCVRESMLAPAMIEGRVIPNGVDLEVFRPADRAAARAELGLPQDVPVVMLTTGSLRSMWKDDATLIRTIELTRRDGRTPQPCFVAVGRESAVPKSAVGDVRVVSFQHDPQMIARYCQASDVYLHASRADNAPLSVLEALACGTPVIASDIGGIPEQVHAVDLERLAAGSDDVGGATGALVPPRDGAAMARALRLLIDRPAALRTISVNAAADARARFSLEQQTEAYLSWFAEIRSQQARTAGEQ